MKKLSLNIQPKSLNGVESKGDNLAKILAGILSNKSPGIDSIKAMDWAMKLFNDGSIEIDRSDNQKLEKFVEDTDQLTNLGKSQIINVLRDLRSTKEKSGQSTGGN